MSFFVTVEIFHLAANHTAKEILKLRHLERVFKLGSEKPMVVLLRYRGVTGTPGQGFIDKLSNDLICTVG
jgi:hypothetical protein